MGFKTLSGIEKIGEFTVVVMDELRNKFPEKFNKSGAMDYAWFEKEIRPNNFIYIRHDVNSIAFTIQKGPIKENGVNGCQVDTIIEAALIILEGLNRQHHHDTNEMAMGHLKTALEWLGKRKKDRVNRGVEGTNNP